MISAELISFAVYALVMVVMATVVVFAIGLSAHVGRHVQRSLFPWVFVAMITSMIWIPISGQRNLGSGRLEFMASATEFGSALWLSRLLTAVVMFIVAARLFGWLFSEKRRRPEGVWLFLALIFTLTAHNFIAGAFGTRRAFLHNSVYPLLLFTAAYFCAQYELNRTIRFAKAALFWFLLLGLLAAIVQPDIAIQKGYKGLVPGLSFRYWGLGSHANTVGPLATLFLLMIWHQPFESRAVQRLAVALGLGSLVLTQSKTAWVSALLALGAMSLARLWPQLTVVWRDRRLPTGLALALMLTAAMSVGLLALAIDPDTVRVVHRFAATDAGASMSTLTGRVDIWALALEDWRRNPLFGYGPTWGDLEYRIFVGNLSVVHAHNQFIHSLAAAGLAGLCATLIYLGLSARYAIRGFVPSSGLTAGLLGLLLVRAITEVPLQISNWGGAEVFIQLLTFVVLLGYGSPRPSESIEPDQIAVGHFSKASA